MDALESPSTVAQRGIIGYLRTLLTATGALFLATLIPTFALAFKGLSSEKATGLAAVAGGLAESVFAPWFWLLFLFCFSLFYVASGAAGKTARIVFFWIPASAISFIGLCLWALFVFFALHSARQQP